MPPAKRRPTSAPTSALAERTSTRSDLGGRAGGQFQARRTVAAQPGGVFQDRSARSGRQPRTIALPRLHARTRRRHHARQSSNGLAAARLYVLIDGGPIGAKLSHAWPNRWSRRASRSCNCATRRSARPRTARAGPALLREITRDSGTLFIMNDRPDLAVLADADGVHVGQDELSVKDARRILGPRGLVGVSTHSLEQARAAVLDGADYIGVGPTFPSGTKQFAEFTGTELLRAVADEIRLPAFAIGGITPTICREVLAAGFTRIAVSGAVMTAAADPAARRPATARATSRATTRQPGYGSSRLGCRLSGRRATFDDHSAHLVARRVDRILARNRESLPPVEHQGRGISHLARRARGSSPAGWRRCGRHRSASRLARGLKKVSVSLAQLAQSGSSPLPHETANSRNRPAVGELPPELHDLRKLANAGRTPGAPVIDQRHPTCQIVQRDRAWRRPSAPRAANSPSGGQSPDRVVAQRLAGAADHQQHVHEDHRGQQCQRNPKSWRAASRSRRGGLGCVHRRLPSKYAVMQLVAKRCPPWRTNPRSKHGDRSRTKFPRRRRAALERQLAESGRSARRDHVQVDRYYAHPRPRLCP